MRRLSQLSLLLALAPAPAKPQDTTHVGGAQTSNSKPAPQPAPSDGAPANPSGTAHVVVNPPGGASGSVAPRKRPPAHAANAPADGDTFLDPDIPIALSAEELAPYILHRQVATYPLTARAANRRASVTVNIVVDRHGEVDTADALGEQDFSQAAIAVISHWRFKPYRYHGTPWKFSATLRFDFTDPAKGTSD